MLGKQLGLELRRSPSDSAFRHFFLQVDVAALCAAIRDWLIAQIPGGAAFIAQVTLDSAALGVAISQACYATGANHKRAVLRQLLGELDLAGVLIQAVGEAFSEGVALHTQKPLTGSSRSRGPTSS